jgi:hypothetical protein
MLEDAVNGRDQCDFSFITNSNVFQIMLNKFCGNTGINLSSLYVQHTCIADRLMDTLVLPISVTGMEVKLKIT